MKSLPILFAALAFPLVANAQAAPDPCATPDMMTVGGVGVNLLKCQEGLILNDLGTRAAEAADKQAATMAKAMSLAALVGRTEAAGEMKLYEHDLYWAHYTGTPEPKKPETSSNAPTNMAAATHGVPASLNVPVSMPKPHTPSQIPTATPDVGRHTPAPK